MECAVCSADGVKLISLLCCDFGRLCHGCVKHYITHYYRADKGTAELFCCGQCHQPIPATEIVRHAGLWAEVFEVVRDKQVEEAIKEAQTTHALLVAQTLKKLDAFDEILDREAEAARQRHAVLEAAQRSRRALEVMLTSPSGMVTEDALMRLSINLDAGINDAFLQAFTNRVHNIEGWRRLCGLDGMIEESAIEEHAKFCAYNCPHPECSQGVVFKDDGLCGTCSHRSCPRCQMAFEKGDDKHECDAEVLKTLRYVTESTSQCPNKKCNARIYKVHGCTQMYCTKCGKLFYYVEGGVGIPVRATEFRHNPHLSEAMHAGIIVNPILEDLQEDQAMHEEQPQQAGGLCDLNTDVASEHVLMLVQNCRGRALTHKEAQKEAKAIFLQLGKVREANDALRREFVEANVADFSVRAAVIHYLRTEDKDKRGKSYLQQAVSMYLKRVVAAERYRELATNIFFMVQAMLVSLRNNMSDKHRVEAICRATRQALTADIEPALAQTQDDIGAQPPKWIRDLWNELQRFFEIIAESLQMLQVEEGPRARLMGKEARAWLMEDRDQDDDSSRKRRKTINQKKEKQAEKKHK